MKEHGRRRVALSVVLIACVALLSACGSGGSGEPATPTGPAATPFPPLEGRSSTAVASATESASIATTPVRVLDFGGGVQILTDSTGMTLYVRADDVPASGVSTCTGTCAGMWPPFQVGIGAPLEVVGLEGFLGTFLREGEAVGRRQVLYKGKPLYRFSGDQNIGDVNGQGLENRWSVAIP